MSGMYYSTAPLCVLCHFHESCCMSSIYCGLLILYFFSLPVYPLHVYFFFFSSRRRHTRSDRDWSSDVCSSDLRVQQRRVVIGPELARRADPVALDNNPHESRCWTRIVAVLDHVLQPQPVGLVFKLPLMPVDHRDHPKLGHKHSQVADESAGGNPGDEKTDTLLSGLVHLPPVVH